MPRGLRCCVSGAPASGFDRGRCQSNIVMAPCQRLRALATESNVSRIAFLRTTLDHPLNKHDRKGMLVRSLRWYLGSRLAPGPVLVPFVRDTSLLISTGMRGATENVYLGLGELSDMAFTLIGSTKHMTERRPWFRPRGCCPIH